MQRATTHEMKPRDNIYISLEKIDDRLSYSWVAPNKLGGLNTSILSCRVIRL